MQFTILIPHYRTGQMTAYTISQLLKLKGRHDTRIIVVDNNPFDGSADYLAPFMRDIELYNYPKEIMQSHGLAFDFAMQYVDTDYFITLESDSYPTLDNWLDYYETLINAGFDGAGSAMHLSGGQYIHPAGALYSRKTWEEAKEYCNNIQYSYFPKIAMKEGHACHLMVHSRIFDSFVKNPSTFVELHYSYKNSSPLELVKAMEHYLPVVGPFHNGVGNKQESIKTYGQRIIDNEVPAVILDNKEDIIYRLGEEPGQWLTYWSLAMGKKIYSIPTYVKWLPGREGQQQEFTQTQNGVIHLWGISAYHKANIPGYEDIIDHKAKKVRELYDSLPDEQKIPAWKDRDEIIDKLRNRD